MDLKKTKPSENLDDHTDRSPAVMFRHKWDKWLLNQLMLRQVGGRNFQGEAGYAPGPLNPYNIDMEETYKRVAQRHYYDELIKKLKYFKERQEGVRD